MSEGEQERELSPSLKVADEYVRLTRRKRSLESDLRTVKAQLEDLQQRVLDLMVAGELPESFKHEGASVFTREDIWASPRDGDHQALSDVLRLMGLVEYLPKSVNSQSLSAYVREHKNDETGEFDETLIDPRLRDVLKISKTTKAIVTG